jgi:hypothetical protein
MGKQHETDDLQAIATPRAPISPPSPQLTLSPTATPIPAFGLSIVQGVSSVREPQAFVADLYDVWQAHGREVLEAARQQKPADWLRVIASILPRDINVSLETMSDKELSKRVDQLTGSLGLKLVSVSTLE